MFQNFKSKLASHQEVLEKTKVDILKIIEDNSSKGISEVYQLIETRARQDRYAPIFDLLDGHVVCLMCQDLVKPVNLGEAGNYENVCDKCGSKKVLTYL